MLAKKITTIGACFFIVTLNCCRSKKGDSDAETLNSSSKTENTKPTHQWKLPDTPIDGCDNIINQIFVDNHIKWLSSPPENQTPLKVFILWKNDSPLAKITFQQIRDLYDQQEASLEIIFLSVEKPAADILTNNKHKHFYFGIDSNNKSAKNINLTTFPQIVMTTQDNKVCWQGHPSHLTSKAIQEIVSKITLNSSNS